MSAAPMRPMRTGDTYGDHSTTADEGTFAAMTPRPDRRRALTIAATVGFGPAVLSACGGDEDAAETPGESLDTGHAATRPPAGPIAKVEDIAVGGGTIFPDEQVVVTQPTEGDFKCFTAVCTHMGCIVSSVQAGGIRCECHGSAFSIKDGSAVNPPATRPLDEVAITVDGDQISIA
jgi:nitrite reductase/ring-hydroxylating ferredoxin subunit